MGSILIVAEIQDGKIRECTYELVAFARGVAEASGREVKSLVLGQGAQPLAEELAKRGGGEVLVADHESLAHFSADAFHAALKAAVEATGADVTLLSNTPTGWELGPRLAASLDAGFVSDAFKVEAGDGGLVFTRRVFNGKLDAQLTPTSESVVATMQPGATSAYEGSEAGQVTKLDFQPGDVRTRFIEKKIAEKTGVDLSKASVIVAGGRGVGAAEKFEEVIRPLADALGGAMGASRPVVDAGWLPHAHQVGSSGQVVSPKLYIACGVSGAIQHIVGMKSSNFIIAVNKDADAPIFEVADLGVAADLFEIVPALTKAIQEAKGA